MEGVKASVVIATKNRKDDLRRAIQSCLQQTILPEIIVIDDGSTDDTYAMVQRDFPTVRLYRDEVSRSVTVQRNRGAQLASSEFIFSIDDDAEFQSPRIIEQTLPEFGPAVGIVAMPLINVNISPEILQKAPQSDRIYLAEYFIGAAYAVRRSVFLKVGGYREFLRQQEEEVDLCIRLLDAGYMTRLGNADPIYHYESPIRDERWRTAHGSRNKVLFCWHNVPMPHLIYHLPAVVANRLLWAPKSRHPIRVVLGTLGGIAACFSQFRERRPVRREIYRLFRDIRRSRPLPLDSINPQLGFAPSTE